MPLRSWTIDLGEFQIVVRRHTEHGVLVDFLVALLVWWNANSLNNSVAPAGLFLVGCGLPGVKTPGYCLAVPAGLMCRTCIPGH